VIMAEKVLVHQNDLAYDYRFHVSKDLP
jgi:hypothetical protein